MAATIVASGNVMPSICKGTKILHLFLNLSLKYMNYGIGRDYQQKGKCETF